MKGSKVAFVCSTDLVSCFFWQLSKQCLSHGNYNYVYADSNIFSKYLGFDRKERGSIFPRISNGASNDMGGKTQDLPATREPVGNTCTVKNKVVNGKGYSFLCPFSLALSRR